MSSQLSLREPLVDLSHHYIIRKLPDGWIVGSMERGDTQFIPRARLIEMGYLNEAELVPQSSPLDVAAIVVPTATDKRRSNDQPPAPWKIGRADLDQNWRSQKTKEKLNQNADQ